VEIIDIVHLRRPLRLAARAAGSLLAGEPLSVTIFRSEEVRRALRRRIQSVPFDVIHFDTIGLADYLDDVDGLPAVMTHHGAESAMIRRRIRHEPNWVKKAFFVAEWKLLERYERRMCGRFPVNVTMSDHDTRLLAGVAPQARFEVVANGVDVDFFAPARRSAARTLIFAGRLDQYSNRDAIVHFMREIWPGVVQRYPDARLHLIGANAPRMLEEMAARDPRVKLHGFVPDVRPFFADATAVVCPNRDGGGTRIKVLDALAQGMPIVSTTICCEGIDVEPERDVLIADTPQAFVAQIARVFDDPTLRTRLAVNARALAERRYSWNALACRLVELYEGLAPRAEPLANSARAASRRAPATPPADAAQEAGVAR
jgi:glycosyltransferase involved in cell wall biosynthesis